jgi:adenylate kinase family enzyme
VYNSETAQVFDYYTRSGKSKLIPGVGSIEEIFDRLVEAIDAAC